MKPNLIFNNRVFMFLLILMPTAYVGCKSEKSDVDSFLKTDGSKDVDSLGDGGEVLAEEPKPTQVKDTTKSGSGFAIFGEADGQKGTVAIPTAEWNEVRSFAAKCRADLDSLKFENETAVKAEYAKGASECRAGLEKERDIMKKAALEESEKIIAEMAESLKKLRYQHALVNGECEGMTKTGEKFVFVLRNRCLNVVHKKIGNDGEIVGLLDAMSVEAMEQGILKLNCEAGRAHINLIPKKCDADGDPKVATGSIEKATDGSSGVSAMKPVSVIMDTPAAKKDSTPKLAP
jgi:hypothetical protein